MIAFSKMHQTVTFAQVSILLVSLSVASLGAFIKYTIPAYFWVLSLICIASILATSIVIGVAIVLRRITYRVRREGGSGGSHGWLSRPENGTIGGRHNAV
jgi:amino acid transporter